ncbi:MAG: hypothetical protein ACRYGR_05990 [Janthinobacterium lividum]
MKRPRETRQSEFLRTERGNWGLLTATQFNGPAPPWHAAKRWCRENLEGLWLRSKADESYFFQLQNEAARFCEAWDARLTHTSTQDI